MSLPSNEMIAATGLITSNQPAEAADHRDHALSAATLAIHADDDLPGPSDIAPPIHVATIFEYTSNPDQLVPEHLVDQAIENPPHVYSRETAPGTTRLETVLSELIGAPAVAYSSGLSALHALYTALNPKRISISSGGYHGSHAVLDLHVRLTGASVLPLNCPASDLGPGDLVHLETPENPYGEAHSIAAFATKAHSAGAFLLVDSTLGPPPLQDPLGLGADAVMHSGTKYFGGHSDALCGVLATRRPEILGRLRRDRVALGSVMGSLEAWSVLRGLRTLTLRVDRQSRNAGGLVAWLEAERRTAGSAAAAVLSHLRHASLQQETTKIDTTATTTTTGGREEGESGDWLARQMPRGWGPVFAMILRSEKLARTLPSKLKLFRHATSLGGVESLVEWRIMSDKSANPALVRVSVGCEDLEDLKDDLRRGFKALLES